MGVLASIWHRLRRHLRLSKILMEKPRKKVEGADHYDKPPYHPDLVSHPMAVSINGFGTLDRGTIILEKVMEALGDPNTHLLGVYGLCDRIKDSLLQRVCRRVQRDNLFDIILTVTVTEKPDLKKFQDEIASQLGFTFRQKSRDERAKELLHRMKIEQKKILIVLGDLYKGLDLRKVGIPYGPDPLGCKILLTSTSEEVLSNQMQTQINFMA